MKEKNMKKNERKPKQLKNKAAQSPKPILSTKQAAKLMRDNYIQKNNKKSAEQTQEHTDETEYAINNIEKTAYMAAYEIMLPKSPKTKLAKEPKPKTKQKTFNYNDDDNEGVSAWDSSNTEQPQRPIPKQQPEIFRQQQLILKQQPKTPKQQQSTPKQQPKTPKQQQSTPKQQSKTPKQQQSIPKQQPKTSEQQQPIPEQQPKTSEQQQSTPKQLPQTTQQKQQISKQKQQLKEKPAYTSKTLEENPKTDIKLERQEPKSKPTAAIIKERQIKSNPLPEEIPRQGVIGDIPTKPVIKEKTVYISQKNSRQDKPQNVQQNEAQFEPHFESAKSDIPIVKHKLTAHQEKPVDKQADFIQESPQNKAQFEPCFELAKTEDNMLANSYAKPQDISPKNKPVNIAPKTRGAAYEKKSVVPKQQTFGREKTAAKLAGRAKEQMRQQTIQKTKKFAGVSAEFGKSLIRFVAKTTVAIAKSLAAMLSGSSVLIILAAVVLIAAVASSPFGLFFAGERSAANAVSLAEAVASVNVAYNAKLEELQEGDYAEIEITGQAAAWSDVLAVFAVKVAGADVGGLDVVTLDSHRVELLKSVFWDMTRIQTETESTDTGEILKITVSAKSADDMRIAYAFSDYQNSALDELLAESSALIALAGSLDITNVDALAVLAALPDDLPEQRRNVVQTALTLYGKVNYFWGGKSLTIGWDSRWGELRKVTAAGSRTTGSYRPFGLDCSGFVDWVFYNVTNGDYIIGHGGGAASQHNYCTDISWAEAMPGDLVFYLEDDHVGIVCGWDDNGNLLVIHCASSANNVVITGASGFSFVARPDYYGD